MLKKALSLMLALVIALSVFPIAYAGEKIFSSAEDTAVYLREQMKMRNGEITFKYSLPVPEISTWDFGAYITAAFSKALEHTGMADEGDYLKREYNGYSASSSGFTYYPTDEYVNVPITISVSYKTTSQQESQLSAKIAEVISEIITPSMSAYEKIEAINTYICDHVEYDYVHKDDNSYLLCHTAYAALIDGKAVCDGYSALFYRMCLTAGIDCRFVSGTADNGEAIEPHAWNIVRLGGVYYYVDTTWNDTGRANDYFLIGSDKMKKDHYGEIDGYNISESDFDINSDPAPDECIHIFTNYISNNDATCTADGTKTAKCERCDATDTITDVSSAKGHTEEIIPAVEATCTETGLTEGLYCSVCGTVIKKQSVVAKTAHSYKYVVTKATLAENGRMVPTCSVCGAKKTASAIYYPKTITLSGRSFTYTGKAIKPTVTVKDSNGKTISSKYYTVSYKNNTNVGKATVTITFKGNYSGTKALSFTIAPKQVTGLKVSSVKTTSITLKWSKVTGAKYYKLEKSTDGKKWTTVTTTDKTTYTVKSLKAGTKYQFRVTALDSTKKISGKSSAVLKTATLTGVPSVTLKSSKSKTATASWKKVTGASKYVVYKSTDGKKWTKVTTTTKLAYTFTKLTGGKKIYVKVTALNAYGKASSFSPVKSVTVKK